ncbi:MAG: 1-acyl-sn-glycerol-3-phosphate acyltransferase [Candidatus Marinimicrobia bacterium]|nr:1-acyl-sn-glycerol-3-phosphate acyltransferase [Candidatus Neomarinimicrobiota bacterium]
MNNHLRSLRNILGLVLKTGVVPFILNLEGFPIASHSFNQPSSIFSWIIILAGLAGLLTSHLLLLRYGDGNAQFILRSTRLVDVGVYARNRHPFFWFLSLYYLGVLINFYGFTLLTFIIWISFVILGLIYLLTIQERFLRSSLPDHYNDYRKNTPVLTWKMKIPVNQSVKILPQLVWIFGMLILRHWYKIEIKGSEHIPHKRPFLLVANHESYLDPFLFGVFVPFELKFVTTADVFTSRLMRFLLGGIGTFPMRRHRQDLKSIRTMIRMINKGQVVGIFPEGGRSIDGTPLPILKETLKLIQHCSVPILPVHLDGAYEIWPRWSSKRRRGKVTATFKPIIPVEDQSDLTTLNDHIAKAIFAHPKVYRSVKSKDIANGLDNFLWACRNCETRNSIEYCSTNIIRCRQCHSEWLVNDDYTLVHAETSESSTLHTWIKDITQTVRSHPITTEIGLDLETDEQMFLSSPIISYRHEENPELTDNLILSLTNKRFILSQNAKSIHSWALEVITIFTMDYYNEISIGVSGIRHTFALPAEEISLKWQTYYEELSVS